MKRQSLFPAQIDSNENWSPSEGLEVDRQPSDRFTSDAWDLMEDAILELEREALDMTQLDLKDPTELTIAAGVIAVTQSFHTVDTQGNAATDNLDTIIGGDIGKIIILRAENNARTVVIRHNIGNIWLKAGTNLNLDDIRDGLALIWDGTMWFDIGAGKALGLDSVNDTHIDWGLGANQVSAVDVPIADAGGIITATEVEGALQEIMTDLDALEVIVAAISVVEINIPAGAWNYPTTNPAPLERDTGANGGMFVNAFDDTTPEFVILEPAFEIPDNLDATGTVYFSLFGYAKTADGNEVQFRISHSSRDKGESWDNAYATEDSGDYVTDPNQDDLDQIEWNETVGNLGWAAQDLIRIMLSRIAITDGTKVTGDYYVCNLKILIPIT